MLNISKEVKVLNIHVHVHVHVMKIYAHWYMFRKGIEKAVHLHSHRDDGLFLQITGDRKAR